MQAPKPSFVDQLHRFSQNRFAAVSLRPRFPLLPPIPASIKVREHKSGLEFSRFAARFHLERLGLSERLNPKYSGLVRASIGVTTGLFTIPALITMTAQLETTYSSCTPVPEGWGSKGGSLDRLGLR
jgi:hypothetical protein